VRSGRHVFAVAAVLLALTACTHMYFKDFAVDPQDRAYTARAQFEDIKKYLLSRELRVVGESDDYFAVQIEAEPASTGRTAPSDILEIRLIANQRVELTLGRRSSGPDFSVEQLKVFREALERRLRERTGRVVFVRLVDERTRPMVNMRLQ
jgi:hypothetical protein